MADQQVGNVGGMDGKDVDMGVAAGDMDAKTNVNAPNAGEQIVNHMEDLYFPNQEISKFSNDVKACRTFASSVQTDLKRHLSALAHRKIESLPLGGTTNSPVSGSAHFMVATDDVDAKKGNHF